MKILQFICSTGFYGAERWILTLAKNLDANIQCDLCVTAEPDNRNLELSRQYRLLGKVVHEVPMQHKFDIGVIRRLCHLVKANGYNLIHSHGYKSDILGLIVARLCGIPALSTPHGFENADDWKLRAYIGAGNFSLRFFDKIAPLSTQLCADVQKIGVNPDKIIYIQNGVDLDEVEAQRQHKDSNPKLNAKQNRRVGFIGQMISRKNVYDLLDIFQMAWRQDNGLELVLLGDGDERPALERYAATLPARDAITFLGFRDDRLEWLQSFDLFAMTSTLEGIPRCLMETMAMGVPVAAYNIPGIDQLVHHEDTGLLATLGDKEALAGCWHSLLYDQQKALDITERARAFIWQHFSGKRMAEEYTTLFKQMLNRT